jgi:hypothetical protein
MARVGFPPRRPADDRRGQLCAMRHVLLQRAGEKLSGFSRPIDSDWLATAGFIQTQRGQTDPSYDALGLVHSGNPWLHEVEAA